jgi:hypothetical protein
MMVRAAAAAMLGGLLSVSAAATETEVLFDGTATADWDTARDAARLQREFSLDELTRNEAGDALVWRFVSKGVSFNDIFLRRPIRRPFDTLRVRVKNEGEAFTFAVKALDASGAEWTANQVKLSRGGDWEWVEFPRADWHVAPWSSDADGKLDFLLDYVALIAFDVRAGPEYRLEVARVEAQRPDPPVATIEELRIPDVLDAGQRYSMSLTFTLDKPCTEEDARVVFLRDGAELFTIPIRLPVPLSAVRPGERVSVPDIDVRVPQYAFGGDYSVALRLGEAHIRQGGKIVDQEVRAVTVKARKPGKSVCVVRPHNGTPTLFINGEPSNGMAYAAYGPSVEVFADFARAGVNLYTFSATPTEAGYGLSRTAWKAPGEYDFSQLDQRVLMVLEANPKAYIFPRLYLHAPKWWSEKHPDDVVLMDPGDGKYVPFIHSGGKPAPSWASEAWRKDTVEGLRHLIAHVEASPYADRVIGYHLASGTTEEWMMWGANEDEWVDYSRANVARFREWLKAKYGTDAGLRKAWNDAAVTLATAAIPPKAQRIATQFGALRDPAKEQPVIDFYLYNSDLVADTISYLAKAVKEITGGEKMVGVFYGYLLQLCGEQRQQNAGHLALEKVLASPDVDFLCSPTSYAFRQLGGEGTSHFMSLLGSVHAHGKVWFDENDIRTSLSPGEVGGWGKPANVAGDILQQDKELADVLVNGADQWWFDVGGNKYNDPVLMRRIGELTRNATQVLALDRRPVDQVAMIVDERSLCYLRVGDPLGRWLLLSQLPALHRIGAPVGHYLVTDLPRIRDRKVFLLMTSFAPTAADRKAIDALKRDGHVLVFCYVPGLYRDGRIDENGMTELTGIKLRLSTAATPLRVTMRPGHAITEGLGGATYGPGDATSPIAYADDPDATVLGTLDDGRPGLVLKQQDGWTAIHSAVPMLPETLLRRIAQFAGVHFYIDTQDVAWADQDMVAVSVKDRGTRTISLPRKANVRDLYTGERLGEGIDSFKADFADRATRVFVLE